MSGSGSESSPIILDSNVESSETLAPALHATPPQPYDESKKQPNLLIGLPIELLRIVTDPTKLSNLDRHSLKMTTHGLRQAELENIRLSKADYVLFNKRLEATLPSRHCLLAQNLLCTNCLTILPKSAFPDSHAKPVCTLPRSCVKCSIANGYFNRRRFHLGGKKHFACGACKKAKPVSMMEPLDKDSELKLSQKVGVFRCVELKVDVGKWRWCKECWMGIKGFWDLVEETGKMKETFRSSASEGT